MGGAVAEFGLQLDVAERLCWRAEHDLGAICPRIGCRQVQSAIEFQGRVQNGMIAAPTRIRLETQLHSLQTSSWGRR